MRRKRIYNPEYQKNYREEHREKIRNYNKVYGKRYYNEKIKKDCELNLKSWEGFIPKISRCEICDREIYFNKKDKSRSINFDHKTGNESIKRQPNAWLRRHPKTIENIVVWNSCNFGKLCNYCNRFLPTKDRKKHVYRVIKYINGD